MALSNIVKQMTGEELLLMTIFNNENARAAVDAELDRRARTGRGRFRRGVAGRLVAGRKVHQTCFPGSIGYVSG